MSSAPSPRRTAHPLSSHPFAGMFSRSRAHSRRASSWDRGGGNNDWMRIEAEQTGVLMEHEGPGCITHLYCAMALEHGHANNFSNDYSSVAYWYQTPQAVLPQLPAASEMGPPLDDGYDEARALLLQVAAERANATDPSRFIEACRVAAPLMRGSSAGVVDALNAVRNASR